MTGTPSQLITKLIDLMEADKDKLYDLKAHKEKRTKSQNAYYWERRTRT